MTALTLLPHVLRALDTSMTEAPWGCRVCNRPTGGDDFEPDVWLLAGGGDLAVITGPDEDRYETDARTIAALRNALPGLSKMAKDWCNIQDAWGPGVGDEALAQRIIDAIRTAAPAVYAQAVAAMEAGDA